MYDNYSGGQLFINGVEAAGYDLNFVEYVNRDIPVPEPATMLLFGTGAGLAGLLRLRKKCATLLSGRMKKIGAPS